MVWRTNCAHVVTRFGRRPRPLRWSHQGGKLAHISSHVHVVDGIWVVDTPFILQELDHFRPVTCSSCCRSLTLVNHRVTHRHCATFCCCCCCCSSHVAPPIPAGTGLAPPRGMMCCSSPSTPAPPSSARATVSVHVTDCVAALHCLCV